MTSDPRIAHVDPVPSLVGQRVTLRPLRPQDEMDRRRLGWSAEIERNFGRQAENRGMTPAEAREWYETQEKHASDGSRRSWVIEEEQALIGVAHLHSISDSDRNARFVIRMFAPRHVGRGLGTEATRSILSHAFDSMGLHRIDLRVLAFNETAIACYRKCGFIVEGRERESCWLDNVWHDDIIMGVLAREYATLGTG